MGDQSKAIKRQQAEFESGCGALRSEAAAAGGRLRGCERLLGQALSLKAVDICWREAGALKVRGEPWSRCLHMAFCRVRLFSQLGGAPPAQGRGTSKFNR